MKYIFLFLLLLGTKVTHAQQVAAKANSEGKYALVVSFGSRSSGPDREGLTKINEIIKQYESKYKKPIAYNIGKYGREGETDYSFDLSNMKKKVKRKFVAELKNTMPKYQTVFVAENEVPSSDRAKRR